VAWRVNRIISVAWVRPRAERLVTAKKVIAVTAVFLFSFSFSSIVGCQPLQYEAFREGFSLSFLTLSIASFGMEKCKSMYLPPSEYAVERSQYACCICNE
jgi:hypothetical protein